MVVKSQGYCYFLPGSTKEKTTPSDFCSFSAASAQPGSQLWKCQPSSTELLCCLVNPLICLDSGHFLLRHLWQQTTAGGVPACCRSLRWQRPSPPRGGWVALPNMLAAGSPAHVFSSFWVTDGQSHSKTCGLQSFSKGQLSFIFHGLLFLLYVQQTVGIFTIREWGTCRNDHRTAFALQGKMTFLRDMREVRKAFCAAHCLSSEAWRRWSAKTPQALLSLLNSISLFLREVTEQRWVLFIRKLFSHKHQDSNLFIAELSPSQDASLLHQIIPSRRLMQFK